LSLHIDIIEMRASHAHIGIAQTVLVSGFSGGDRGLNGPYDVDLAQPENLIYRRRVRLAPVPGADRSIWTQLQGWFAGPARPARPASLMFDAHVKGGGRWTLRAADGGVVVGHARPGEWLTPAGEYSDAHATGRVRVTVAPELKAPSLWAVHVFPAPSL